MVGVEFDVEFSAIRHRLLRVQNKIGETALQPLGIGLDERYVGPLIEINLYRLLLCLFARERQNAAAQISRGHRLQIEIEWTPIAQKIPYQTVEPLYLIFDAVHLFEEAISGIFRFRGEFTAQIIDSERDVV